MVISPLTLIVYLLIVSAVSGRFMLSNSQTFVQIPNKMIEMERSVKSIVPLIKADDLSC